MSDCLFMLIIHSESRGCREMEPFLFKVVPVKKASSKRVPSSGFFFAVYDSKSTMETEDVMV